MVWVFDACWFLRMLDAMGFFWLGSLGFGVGVGRGGGLRERERGLEGVVRLCGVLVDRKGRGRGR